MHPAEATELLALASSFDNRNPDEANAFAWAAALDGVRMDDAKAAIIAHYQSDHRWIMPSDVRKGVARICEARRKVLEQTDLPPELEQMEDGPEFTAAYLAWQRSGGVGQRQLTA